MLRLSLFTTYHAIVIVSKAFTVWPVLGFVNVAGKAQMTGVMSDSRATVERIKAAAFEVNRIV